MVSEIMIQVTVAYSSAPRTVQEIALCLPSSSTVLQALQTSGLPPHFFQTDRPDIRVGVWGRQVNLDQPLREMDRIEIYRLLTVDPKVARRERFAKQGVKTAGLFTHRRTGAAAGY